MEPWQERMARKARQSDFYATLNGAFGWCTDEGSEYRPAVFEYSRLDALIVARSGYLGDYAQHCANSKDLKKQRDVSDFLAAPDTAEAAGVVVKVDVTERQLGKAEFFARRAAGVAQLMPHGRFTTTREAELEWMRREAEVETGFLSDDPHPTRRKIFARAYATLRAHDYR